MGNAGANRITGGLGADLLKGRGGADRFVFNDPDDSTSPGMDVIGDFSRAQGDRIHLANIDAIARGRDDSFRFIGERALHHAGDLRFARFSDWTLVQGDINGDGLADFQIMIDRNIKLIESDFIL